MNIFVIALSGVMLGWFLNKVVPTKFARPVTVCLGCLLAVALLVVAIPQSAMWRAHNVPALATESERTTASAVDQINELTAKAKEAWQH